MLTINKIKAFLSSTPFLLLFIVLASTAFRLTNLDLIEFKTDEAINLLLAARPLFGHDFVSGGTVSSLGILNPPIFNYILFPIVLISLDPRIVSLFVALINVAAIMGIYFLIKRYYCLTTAVVASLLISFSPWAILYSRKIWMQDLLLPFAVLMLLAVHKLIVEKKEKYWILYATSSLILIQLHPVSAIFVLTVSIFLVIKKTKLHLKYLVIGLLIGLIPLVPYIMFEIQNGCPDCSTLISSKNKLSPGYSLETFFRPLQIVGVGDFRFILGDDTLTFAQKFPIIYRAREILYLEYLLLPFGFLIFVLKNSTLSFLGYATLLTIVSYFFLKIEPFMHYYIILLPLLFLFLATSFSFFLNSKKLFLRIGGAMLLLLILLTSMAFNYAFFDLLKMYGGTEGDYGSTYISSNKGAQMEVSKHRDDAKFQERLLTNYIPLSYMYGYMPLSKMLYGDIIADEIPIIEDALKKDPKDKKNQFKLFSFYTKTRETVETIYILRNKSLGLPQYKPIYEEVLRHYMGSHFKKQHSSSSYSFFYPEHWILTERDDGRIILNGDGYDLTIKNLGQDDMYINCVEINNKCNKDAISEIEDSIRPL